MRSLHPSLSTDVAMRYSPIAVAKAHPPAVTLPARLSAAGRERYEEEAAAAMPHAGRDRIPPTAGWECMNL